MSKSKEELTGRYIIMFVGENSEAFHVEEILPAPLVASAIRHDEDSQKAIISKLLLSGRNKDQFYRISPTFDRQTIWQHRVKIFLLDWAP